MYEILFEPSQHKNPFNNQTNDNAIQLKENKLNNNRTHSQTLLRLLSQLVVRCISDIPSLLIPEGLAESMIYSLARGHLFRSGSLLVQLRLLPELSCGSVMSEDQPMYT
eukprot:6475461-Amphidinium_carterae.2